MDNPTSETRQPLASRLVEPAIHRGQRREIALDSVWRELRSGKIVMVDEACTETGCFLAVDDVHDSPLDHRVGVRNVDVLERLLLGQSQKAIAVDLGLSPAAVATIVSRTLRALSMGRIGCRVPALLVMAYHAYEGSLELGQSAARAWEWSDPRYRIVGSMRPDRHLEGLLTAGESAVARMLVDGSSYAEMARRRNRSIRTIANQINRSYVKLGVSGRVDFLRKLLDGHASVAAPSDHSAHPYAPRHAAAVVASDEPQAQLVTGGCAAADTARLGQLGDGHLVFEDALGPGLAIDSSSVGPCRATKMGGSVRSDSGQISAECSISIIERRHEALQRVLGHYGVVRAEPVVPLDVCDGPLCGAAGGSSMDLPEHNTQEMAVLEALIT